MGSPGGGQEHLASEIPVFCEYPAPVEARGNSTPCYCIVDVNHVSVACRLQIGLIDTLFFSFLQTFASPVRLASVKYPFVPPALKSLLQAAIAKLVLCLHN